MAENGAFLGQDRRAGVDRRREPPTKASSGPTLHGAVSVPGKGTFGPGQEGAFKKAVDEVNAEHTKAGKEGKLVDLDHLTRKRVISGFGGEAEEIAFTRNRQLEGAAENQSGGGEERIREHAEERTFAVPGSQTLEEVHPVGPTDTDRRLQGAAFGHPVLAGERSATEAGAKGTGTTPTRREPATSSGDASTESTRARRGGTSRPSRGGAGRTRSRE